MAEEKGDSADEVAAAAAGAADQDRVLVVAVDEGEESQHALRWCLRNLLPPSASSGSRQKTVLYLVYAKPAPPAYSSLDGTGYMFSSDVLASMDRYTKDLAASVMEKARRECRPLEEAGKVEVREKVSSGDARDVICDMVEQLGADLLVVGSHGYGFIKRTLIGSVSDHCLRNAKCPVLIVKRPHP